MTPARHPLVTEDLDAILSDPWPWEAFSGATVYITGAGGVLPAYMAETVLRLNETGRLACPARVVGLARDTARAAARFAAYAGRNDLTLIQGDVLNPVAWEGQIDYLVHGASPASPKAMAADPIGTFSANAIGTRLLLDMARKQRARGFLYLSSGAVYGDVSPALKTVRESDYGSLDPTTPRAVYDEGKRVGETWCALYARQYGSPARMARISHTYGPGLRPDDGRAFADIVAAAVERRPIALHGSGEAVRHFAYLSDTVAGLFAILLKGNDGEACNVGGDESLSIRELAELAASLFPERGLTVMPGAQSVSTAQAQTTGAQNAIPLDTARLRALGWRPKIKLAEGMRRTVLSYDLPG